MVSFHVLGTSGMLPLPQRYLSSAMYSCHGVNFLIDAGEGTQMALREAGISIIKIDYILLTHIHTDHVGGLAGLLASMINLEKRKPLTIIGPLGILKVVEASKKLVSRIPFDVKIIELDDVDNEIIIDGIHIKTIPLEHSVTCFGYSFYLPRAGKCDVEMAKRNNVPQKFWTALLQGETIVYEGRTLTSNLINHGPRRGIKVVYATDTRYCEALVKAADDADLFICEGMYGDSETSSDKLQCHMTMQEAALIAKKAKVKELILTHFSPIVVSPKIYLDSVKSIFPNTKLGYCGLRKDLTYRKE